MARITHLFLLTVALAACITTAAAERVYLQVLGIAQDAGYPQASCYRPHCMRAWQDPALRRLTSSIAVVDEGSAEKYLFDATPDIRGRLYQLHLAAPDEKFTLAGIFLTHAHIGHYAGLMQFGREAMGARGVAVFAMPRMHRFLSDNGPWDQLVRIGNIRLLPLENDKTVPLNDSLTVTPFVVPHRDEYSETVGYRINGPSKKAVFIPDIDKWDRWKHDIRDIIRSVDYALLDATFFNDDELPGRDMSKIPHPFVRESMALFESLTDEEKSRVIFIHMNHSNPLLIEASDAQTLVRQRGFRFAYEGMTLEL